MLKYWVLSRLKKKFQLRRKAIDLMLSQRDIKQMSDSQAKGFTLLYKEVDEKIAAVDLLINES